VTLEQGLGLTPVATTPESMKAAGEKPGLFYVANLSLDAKKNLTYQLYAAKRVLTNIAYVNGILGDLSRHITLAAGHIRERFGALPSAFTLFHNPSRGFLRDGLQTYADKLGFTSPEARMLGNILFNTHNAGHQVTWIAHSQGGAIFSEAMRYAGSTLGATDLSNNSVIFHAGASNAWVTNGIARELGVHVGGYFGSPADAVPQIVGMNGNPFEIGYSLVNAWRLFIERISPHTYPGSDWVPYAEQPDPRP
jgi:hypothetical protein